MVADRRGPRVRFVDGAGVTRTIAGSGSSGFTGYGGLALSATFTSPTALLSLQGDRTLVADGGASAVRLIAEAVPAVPLVARWHRVPASVRNSLPRRLALTVTRPARVTIRVGRVRLPGVTVSAGRSTVRLPAKVRRAVRRQRAVTLRLTAVAADGSRATAMKRVRIR